MPVNKIPSSPRPIAPAAERPVSEEAAVRSAEAELAQAEDRLEKKERAASNRALVRDPEFRNLIASMVKVEDAANALAVAMTYLRQYPSTNISTDDVKRKMVGHIGATTSITRTWLSLQAALKTDETKRALGEQGIDQCHVVTGPGHGAAAVFALHFLDGTLEKIYPNRYPRTAAGLQNLIADFCRPHSPLPSHTYPGIPSVSEGGELGYSMGIAAGAGLANDDAVILAQIGDKESESGPLQAAIENHNAIYDFRKGLVLPVVHANGLGISGSSIFAARTDSELRSYLKGLGYSPHIVDAEDTPAMRLADAKAQQLEELVARRAKNEGDPQQLDRQITELDREIVDLRHQSATETDALLQRTMRAAIVSLGRKRQRARELERSGDELQKARQQLAANPYDQVAAKRVEKLEAQVAQLARKLRDTRTPFIVYREDKGGGMAPSYVHGAPTKGAPSSHQLILNPKDLLSTDPSTRKILERWLGDLTGAKGAAAMLPAEGSELGRATDRALPDEDMRPGSAPLATGRAPRALTEVEPAAFLAELPAAGRGADRRGCNELLDRYLASYLDQNRGDAYLFSADTAESNRLKKTVNTLGRRFNLERGENHSPTMRPDGDLVDTLSEQYLMAMAQGVANSGKQAIISNYEAFFQVTTSMVRQYLKFRKQAAEANTAAEKAGRTTLYRPPVPNMVFHLSSLAFAQDHNGLSHQNPGLVDDMAAEPRKYVSVYMPAEANSAVLMADKAVRGKDQVVALIVDKQERAQFLSPAEARELADNGGGIFRWASSVDPSVEKPDVVLAASGGYHTDEVLAASQILMACNRQLESEGKPAIKFATVNVTEPFKLRAPELEDNVVVERLRALGRAVGGEPDRSVFDQASFDRLFPPDTPVVYNFGGFERTAKGLFLGRGRQVSCHGYINEGSTTTRFDMMVRNRCDRFSLVVDAVERAFQNGSVDASTRERVQTWCAEQLKQHDARMAHGAEVDPPEITGGIWPGQGGVPLEI
ncbi:MAG: hypothetical protein JXR83_14505 [Deltaproteobacteria bacterium]|nr:hypothetical protein [Deltaproteobacteria bacterium]